MEKKMQELVTNSLMIEGLVLKRNAVGRAIYNKQAVSRLVARCKEPGVSIARAAMVWAYPDFTDSFDVLRQHN
jgi:hypothetical protein